jgi:hypothetical protein
MPSGFLRKTSLVDLGAERCLYVLIEYELRVCLLFECECTISVLGFWDCESVTFANLDWEFELGVKGIEFICVCEIYLSLCMELANHVESCCVVWMFLFYCLCVVLPLALNS